MGAFLRVAYLFMKGGLFGVLFTDGIFTDIKLVITKNQICYVNPYWEF